MNHASCEHLLEHLSSYLDGEASAAVCADLERHLAQCERCRIVVDTTRQTIHLYEQIPRSPMPNAARKRLYKALDLDEYRPRQEG
jgi:anti-sigma factor RsiW